jgi:hypothetical protein
MNKTETNNKKIRDTIILIQQFLTVDSIKQLYEDDFDEYRKTLNEIFPIFSAKFPSLFEKIIKKEDISQLNIILDTHVQISHGELTMEEGEKQIGLSIVESIEESN